MCDFTTTQLGIIITIYYFEHVVLTNLEIVEACTICMCARYVNDCE